MAESGHTRPNEQDFAFRNVQLLKNETLGTGSYGAVCKAKCDQLICAAKLLYPVLFQMQAPDPGKEHRQPFRRFESECHFLSRVNHPNIVQYLGTYHDPETNALVLLMELMDESLTHFLESSPGDIPYHIQVNLSYDIAQALAFLHANGIIHRDLSSNNVLLIAGSRAKVTDFGMSKFSDMNMTRLATMTTCPGTPVFMSPEALSEPPVYTEKLDNFSLGVLLVQIVTREFPKPTDRFQLIQIPNPRNPSSTIQAQVPIPEVERRQAHISLIEPTHPLLPTALHCLKDAEVERPSSQQLCQTLGTLKKVENYTKSSQQDVNQMQIIRDKDEQLRIREDIIREKTEELAIRDGEIRDKNEQLRIKDEQTERRSREVQDKDEQIKLKDVQLRTIDEQIENKNREIRARDEQIRLMSEQLRAKDERIKSKDEEIKARDREIKEREEDLIRGKQTHQEESTLHSQGDGALNLTMELEMSVKANLALQQVVEDREKKLIALNQQLEANAESCASLQQTAAQQEKQLSSLQGMLSTKEEDIYSLSSQLEKLKLDLQQSKATPRSKELPLKLVWGSLINAPVIMWAGSSTVIGHTAYVWPDWGQIVQRFDSSRTQWSILPPHPFTGFSVVNVSDTLTTVGGLVHSKPTNKLYSFTGKKWIEHLPPMPTKRATPAVVCASNVLVVAGGRSDSYTSLSTVEVLNTHNNQWYSVSDLPSPPSHPSMAVHEDHIYIALGAASSGQDKFAVFRTSALSLPLIESGSTEWKQVASLPVRSTSLASISGHLLAVGGKDSIGVRTKGIYEYDSVSDAWRVVSQMSVARDTCLTVLLPGNKLMVVGGYEHKVRRSIEIASAN